MMPPLVAALVFRTATILASREGILHKKLEFFGGCKAVHPPYTTARIFLTRSLARPLVRGEFRAIIVFRAISLTALCITLPFVALDYVVISPQSASVYMRPTIVHSPQLSVAPTTHIPRGNENISILAMTPSTSGYSYPTKVSPVLKNGTADCSLHQDAVAVIECPFSWNEIFNITISINFTGPAVAENPTGVIYVKVGQGNARDIAAYGRAIPILGGSHLLALATTGVREVFAPVSSRSSNLVGLVLGRNTRKVVVTEFNVVQPDPRLSNTGLDSATLFIIPAAFGVDPVILSQDYTDTSVQDGFASLGGFWSFVNGVFVIFFGANIMYFLFGTRPLSALGLVHVVQRSSLVKNWYQDFPALRTEGGQPGTENAGIVAFIRQRLVDVGPDEEVESDQRTIDLEAQDSTGGAPYEEIPQIEEGVELERIQVEAVEVDVNSAQVSTVGTAIAEVEK
ncbi:hypothetical protein B0H11DRAFT_2006736 [Mycena galericulata]|nr:hypothetical protein B0H11DRAFT_2006736 [Mycena galericulata]